MFTFLDIVVISAVSLIALTMILFVWVMSQPRGDPLRELGLALTKRAALTGGVAIVDPATIPIPEIGFLIIVGSIALLGYYWWTFFAEDVRDFSKPSLSQRPSRKDEDIEVKARRV